MHTFPTQPILLALQARASLPASSQRYCSGMGVRERAPLCETLPRTFSCRGFLLCVSRHLELDLCDWTRSQHDRECSKRDSSRRSRGGCGGPAGRVGRRRFISFSNQYQFFNFCVLGAEPGSHMPKERLSVTRVAKGLMVIRVNCELCFRTSQPADSELPRAAHIREYGLEPHHRPFAVGWCPSLLPPSHPFCV